MAADWTLRERLAALAAFRPIFEQPESTLFEGPSDALDGDKLVLGGTVYLDPINRFCQMAEEYGWVRVFDWSSWSGSRQGKTLHEDPSAVATAHEDDLAALITTIVRADRFSEGHLAAMISNGLLLRVATRAESLLTRLPKARLRGRH